MRHRHPGTYRSRTPKGRIAYKRRPIHSHNKFQKKYQPIVDRARAKGYKVYDLDGIHSAVDEVNIPESYRTDGFIVPDNEGRKRRDLIFIDDDAREEQKKKAFAHELGHQHMFIIGEDDGVSNSNVSKIERKADKIGADILGISLKEFNNPDATYKDVVSGKRNFFRNDEDPIDKALTKEGRFLFPSEKEEYEEERRTSRRFTQSLFHAGNEPPSEKIKRGELVFGFSSPEFAEAWAEKHGYDDVYQFQTSDYDLDEKQYIRDRRGEKVISDNEFIARNVLKEEDID